MTNITDGSYLADYVGKLEAENAKLRHDLEEANNQAEEVCIENAKLRELLQDLAICACGKYCYGCPHQYDGCDRDQRLRELGVEVDA